MRSRELEVVDRIVIHRSKSLWGNAKVIDEWHRAAPNFWDAIGYHKVICNAYPTGESFRLKQPQIYADGKIEDGRDYKWVGAHVRGKTEAGLSYNTVSIGICLIGKTTFTYKQILALRTLVDTIRYELGPLPIYGHDELQSGKVCPYLDMDFIRELIPIKPLIGPPSP